MQWWMVVIISMSLSIVIIGIAALIGNEHVKVEKVKMLNAEQTPTTAKVVGIRDSWWSGRLCVIDVDGDNRQILDNNGRNCLYNEGETIPVKRYYWTEYDYDYVMVRK